MGWCEGKGCYRIIANDRKLCVACKKAQEEATREYATITDRMDEEEWENTSGLVGELRAIHEESPNILNGVILQSILQISRLEKTNAAVIKQRDELLTLVPELMKSVSIHYGADAISGQQPLTYIRYTARALCARAQAVIDRIQAAIKEATE